MSAMNPYRTLRQFASDEFIINKSRFIGYAAPCETEAEALAFLQSIRTKHKDATHNCYAYIIGLNSGIMRYSDDGEPSGTAGKPIIPHLEGRELINICVGVIRYYGGINLGTGGLVRAYAGTAKMALDNAAFGAFIEQAEFEFTLNYKQIDGFKRDLAQLGGELIHAEFADVIHAWVRVPVSAWDALRDKYAV